MAYMRDLPSCPSPGPAEVKSILQEISKQCRPAWQVFLAGVNKEIARCDHAAGAWPCMFADATTAVTFHRFEDLIMLQGGAMGGRYARHQREYDCFLMRQGAVVCQP